VQLRLNAKRKSKRSSQHSEVSLWQRNEIPKRSQRNEVPLRSQRSGVPLWSRCNEVPLRSQRSEIPMRPQRSEAVGPAGHRSGVTLCTAKRRILGQAPLGATKRPIRNEAPLHRSEAPLHRSEASWLQTQWVAQRAFNLSALQMLNQKSYGMLEQNPRPITGPQ
jgi:hypothetical protein